MLQLEKIKKGEGLVKDEDETLIANTYDPDDIKSKKSNKRRQQEQINNSLGKNPYGIKLVKLTSLLLTCVSHEGIYFR